ncbi:fructosamine kinase family protein [Catellatospora bangladeshensis]|uniref:fructosamine kinase family protein n=1 Tax=Catellatospora bangladeshensis TaxID=310355 RepID=UPI00361349D9
MRDPARHAVLRVRQARRLGGRRGPVRRGAARAPAAARARRSPHTLPVGPGTAGSPPGRYCCWRRCPRCGAAAYPEQWRAIGRTLAILHSARGDRFGLAEFDGYFGPLAQDNRPTGTGWAGFYAQRRLLPRLRDAVASGNLPAELATGVERLAADLPRCAGPSRSPPCCTATRSRTTS